MGKITVDNYSTTVHFRERLLERFNVDTDPLHWARSFFKGNPELISDIGDTQKWSNGNIVVVVSTKTKNYITAYPIVETIAITEHAYQEFSKVANRLVDEQEKATIKQIAQLKKNLLTKVGDKENSLTVLKRTNDEITSALENLDEFTKSIEDYLESAVSQNNKKKDETENQQLL